MCCKESGNFLEFYSVCRLVTLFELRDDNQSGASAVFSVSITSDNVVYFIHSSLWHLSLCSHTISRQQERPLSVSRCFYRIGRFYSVDNYFVLFFNFWCEVKCSLLLCK